MHSINGLDHVSSCKFRIASEGSVAIECDHGHNVCPVCDPCTCYCVSLQFLWLHKVTEELLITDTLDLSKINSTDNVFKTVYKTRINQLDYRIRKITKINPNDWRLICGNNYSG